MIKTHKIKHMIEHMINCIMKYTKNSYKRLHKRIYMTKTQIIYYIIDLTMDYIMESL